MEFDIISFDMAILTVSTICKNFSFKLKTYFNEIKEIISGE